MRTYISLCFVAILFCKVYCQDNNEKEKPVARMGGHSTSSFPNIPPPLPACPLISPDRQTCRKNTVKNSAKCETRECNFEPTVGYTVSPKLLDYLRIQGYYRLQFTRKIENFQNNPFNFLSMFGMRGGGFQQPPMQQMPYMPYQAPNPYLARYPIGNTYASQGSANNFPVGRSHSARQGSANNSPVGRSHSPTARMNNAGKDTSSQQANFQNVLPYGQSAYSGNLGYGSSAYGAPASYAATGFGSMNNYPLTAGYGSQAPYGSQASYGSQVPYGSQASYGSQTPYGSQAPYGSQVPYAASQTAYGSPTSYGGQSATYGFQSSYGTQGGAYGASTNFNPLSGLGPISGLGTLGNFGAGSTYGQSYFPGQSGSYGQQATGHGSSNLYNFIGNHKRPVLCKHANRACQCKTQVDCDCKGKRNRVCTQQYTETYKSFMVREWVQAKPTYHVKTDQAIDLTQQQQPQTQPQPKPQPHTGVAQARNHQPHDSQYQQQAPQPARSNNFFYPGFPSGSYQYVRRMLYYMMPSGCSCQTQKPPTPPRI